MSNFSGRPREFTPAVYTRYFERTESSKSSSGHIHFHDDAEETSKDYQLKRDSLFKRLFPTKYADSSDNINDQEQIVQNGSSNALNRAAQSLGDFIPLSNNDSSLSQRKSSSPLFKNDVLSDADDNEEDLLIEDNLPTIQHELIVGHLHPRSTIENVRAILIRELYQRTSDPHTEWLKCKMGLSQTYINPKYYADFQRRYRKDIQRNKLKKRKSTPTNNETENNYPVFDLTGNDESRVTTRTNDTFESDDVIETSFKKSVKKTSPSSPIDLSNDSPKQSKSMPKFIVIESDEDDNNLNSTNDSLNNDTNSIFFIDRSSTSFTAVLQPISASNDDYHKEDSKYDQLPSLNASSNSIIRPIISKHQRRKHNHANDLPKPLVSAIDRIIDQIDKNHSSGNSTTVEQQNLIIKQMKKRKKKKKNKTKVSTTD